MTLLRVILPFALVMMSSCTLQRVDESVDRAERAGATARQYASVLRNQRAETARETVIFSEKPWVSTQPLVTKRGLPPALNQHIAYRPARSVTITEVAQYITTETGLPVVVAPDAVDPSILNATTAAAGSSIAPPAISPISPNSLEGLYPASATGASPNFGMSLNLPYSVSGIKFSGAVSGLLDQVTGRLGLSWQYAPEIRGVKITNFDTRTFDVWAFGDDQVIESTVKSGLVTATGSGDSSTGGSGGSGATGESGSSQSTTVTIKTSLLGDIENNVKSMLSTQPAGRMFLSRTTGTLTVSDRPDVLNRVSAYLKSINSSITRQVVFNVTVFEVSLTDRHQLAVDWSAVYQSISSDWGFSLANTVAGISNEAVSGSFGILDTADSPWAGSTAVMQALAQQGRISNIRTPSVTTLNLQPAPIQIGNVQSYIASSSTTTTASVGSSTSLNQATITSGFNMMLLPKVIDRDNLLLMINLSMSSRPTFQTFTSNDSSVQTADYDTKNAAPKVKLRSGQTLVLTGFEENREDASRTGVGSARFFGLGGGRVSSSEHSVLVVLVTPVVEPDNLNTGSIQFVPDTYHTAVGMAANEAFPSSRMTCRQPLRACSVF
ncbi:type IVB pilus formation outer membrane protein, R64 PilN family [Pseudomonas sp. PA15(2017)]|uniref:PilN family type IVB pilus formation outer membrane protein n=1 Tax=Pseudomonas sp. PA15(2017) TaxID=1932111 RepID=UPI0009667E56|nr:PilN family type IVB pilus formation outer membrane protein [Pseudomonas sp. PA15(2017)]OLU25490.1 type IVB pilus formation outer membrane protein, R64 PilN family [Pseudomonas sp. PA15(2017)]